MSPTKIIEDLPHFTIASCEPGERKGEFKLHGKFDKTVGVREERCWLLLPERNCLIGDLTSFDPASGAAVFITPEESAPNIVGAKLPYVDGYWQAYHVWMVSEPKWMWERQLLRHRDIVAEIFETDIPQTVQGQEVTKWIRVKERDDPSGKERLYPVLGEDPQAQISRLVAGGWDHSAL